MLRLRSLRRQQLARKEHLQLRIGWPVTERLRHLDVQPTAHVNVASWPRWNGHRPPFGDAGAQQMCGGPPEPIGINVPEWRFDTST